MTAAEFDAAFDRGDDITDYLDLENIKVLHPVQRISIDLPKKMIMALSKKAAQIGVARTALIKMWIAERLAKQNDPF